MFFLFFIPASGMRFHGDSQMLDVSASYGYYWSAAPNDFSVAYRLYFYYSYVFPQYYNDRRTGGFSVRPVQE